MTRDPIPIPGCRHDILGHNLKAIGLLRVLATCADPDHRDSEAEGWWDLDSARFFLRSDKYPNEDKLVEFFAEHYRPTPIFSPWNTGGGLDEKRELLLKISRQPLAQFLWRNRKILINSGYKVGKHTWKHGRLTFDLKGGELTLQPPEQIEVAIEKMSGKRPQQKVVIQWAPSVIEKFSGFLCANLEQLEKVGSVPKSIKEKLEQGDFFREELCLTVRSLDAAMALDLPEGIIREIRIITSGEKATVAVVQKRMASHGDIIKSIEAGCRRFTQFQAADTPARTRELCEVFRDELPDLGALAMDAVLTSRTGRASDNPLFLKRGAAGNSEIFRAFWSYFLAYNDRPADFIRSALFSQQSSLWDKEKSPGTPFFPDAIKTYNNGLGWILETFRFNAFDYLMAVEGALALRGAVSRSLAANSRRFAAFPFVFDSGEDFVDDSNEVKGTASSIWLPLWGRPATFSELASFICDAQARLPGKEARFSAEFARALRVQGVDAGFPGWQEFRFKMKASRVPWVCTGRYLAATSDQHSIRLNDALAPLDDCGFLDQFEPLFKGNNIDSRSPHPVRTALNAAIEETLAAPKPDNALGILLCLYDAYQQMALSKSFRERLRSERATFSDALPQEPWEDLLRGLEYSAEFRVARALASLTGFAKQVRQSNGKAVFSEIQPCLGSLLPLKRRARGWYLPTESKDRSKQAVWSGTDLCHDLARVLARRYLDSLDDDRPALMSPRPAPLDDVIAFLNGQLDDRRIARWAEALSLIGWHWNKESQDPGSTPPDEESSSEGENDRFQAIPPAYAALRALLAVECEWQGKDAALWNKRRSQRPIVLLCQRVPSSLSLAVEDALRWLSIWGVPNCWNKDARLEKRRLAGRDVIRVDHRALPFDYDPAFVHRLAAAVAIPLDWAGQWNLYRSVTLPQVSEH